MGLNNSSRMSRHPSYDVDSDINLDHFHILRAIGKGSFGKVSIVQKKDTGKMYAMKYMNKQTLVKRSAVHNVFSEVELMTSLNHPFLVNLWFTFQDDEDLFIVVDLLLGGDVRYHLANGVQFNESHVMLFISEIALALQYLGENGIVHRDIKPDNILLDEQGHFHVTDFNVAIHLEEGQTIRSLSGTKPYMAPEAFASVLDESNSGYSYPVDWWSLGICAYEMLRGKRPYSSPSMTESEDHDMVSEASLWLNEITSKPIHYPSRWDPGITDLMKSLLDAEPETRTSSLDRLACHLHLKNINFEQVLRKEVKPNFVPPTEHLNCDPTYELEEMIMEVKPLHQKKKRLAKQNARNKKQAHKKGDQRSSVDEDKDSVQLALEKISREFLPLNKEILLGAMSSSNHLRDSQISYR